MLLGRHALVGAVHRQPPARRGGVLNKQLCCRRFAEAVCCMAAARLLEAACCMAAVHCAHSGTVQCGEQ
eukprot:363193-Chlamydomonas_euryale.AAC.4